MRFTRHYSGSPVCAPTRCVLLTGKHTGHAYIRNNKEMGGWGKDEPEGQLALADGEVTLAEFLKDRGYRTGFVGKWGLGGPESEGHPNHQGFDFFHGYLCQRVAHNYYPTHLWRNGEKDLLDGNDYFDAHQRIEAPPEDPGGYDRYRGRSYACDALLEEALGFIRRHRDRPFFLEFATPVPHVALQVPEDSLARYSGRFDDEPYLGNQGYLPHPEPRAAYAAMITRMDRDVGRILDLLGELGLDGNTVVLFTSDNGPTYNGGVDAGFFRSAGTLRGLKGSVYEGGLRVPLIVRYPGRVAAGSVSDRIGAHWDLLPTVLELCGGAVPEGLDGVSLVPTLLGRPETTTTGEPRERELYWELGNKQALLAGELKLVRIARRGKDGPVIRDELYDLAADPGEEENLAGGEPEVLAAMIARARAARVPSAGFTSPFDEAD